MTAIWTCECLCTVYFAFQKQAGEIPVFSRAKMRANAQNSSKLARKTPNFRKKHRPPAAHCPRIELDIPHLGTRVNKEEAAEQKQSAHASEALHYSTRTQLKPGAAVRALNACATITAEWPLFGAIELEQKTDTNTRARQKLSKPHAKSVYVP